MSKQKTGKNKGNGRVVQRTLQGMPVEQQSLNALKFRASLIRAALEMLRTDPIALEHPNHDDAVKRQQEALKNVMTEIRKRRGDDKPEPVVTGLKPAEIITKPLR